MLVVGTVGSAKILLRKDLSPSGTGSGTLTMEDAVTASGATVRLTLGAPSASLETMEDAVTVSCATVALALPVAATVKVAPALMWL